MVQLIRDGYGSVTACLLMPSVARFSDFMQDAFGATKVARQARPDGTFMHLEVRIGNSMVMAGEPTSNLGPMPGQIFLYVENCDSVYAQALKPAASLS